MPPVSEAESPLVESARSFALVTLACVAAIIGGFGNVGGALVGGLILGVLESLAVAFVSSGYKDVIAMSILIVIMILLPNGMLGRRMRKGG